MSSRRRRKRGGGGNASDDGNKIDAAKSPKANRNRNNGSGSNKNNKSGGNNKSGSNSKGGSGRPKGKPKAPKFDAADFWGDNESLPEPRGYEVDIEDTTAILRSLGQPPIPGSEAAAEHHFSMVYERSVNLAKALAAAGGLGEAVEAAETPTEG